MFRGDVLIKSDYPFNAEMQPYAGTVMHIEVSSGKAFLMREDEHKNVWLPEMIEREIKDK
jgi:hypothetical protein